MNAQLAFSFVGQPEPVRAGRVYRFRGQPYAVGLLNGCRARLDPRFRVPREIVSRLHDIRRTIYTTPPSVNVAPSTVLCPVLEA